MTGNQIAYASVKVSERNADETERHNKATEALTDRELDIKEMYNQIQDNYNTNMLQHKKDELEWTKQYNKGLLTIQEKEQLVNASWKAVQEQYYGAMTEYTAAKEVLEADIAEETKRHNERNEYLEFWGLELKDKAQQLQKYEIEQTAAWRWEELGLKKLQEQHSYNLNMQQYELDYRKMLDNWSLGLMNIGIQQRRNNLAADELSFRRTQWDEQRNLGYVNKFAPSTDQLLKTGGQILGGWLFP